MTDTLSELEQRMQAIEERIISAESRGSAPSSGEEVERALHEYQVQVLAKLKAIKQKIMEDGGDTATIKRERDQALVENASLRNEVEKLNYRIKHLVRALNEEEQKSR